MAPMQSSAGPAIRSRRHPIIRSLRELAGDPAARHRERAFLADGVRLLEEALRRRAPIELAILSPRLGRTPRGRALGAGLRKAARQVEDARDDVLEAVIGSARHQGVAARLPLREAGLRGLLDPQRCPLLLVAEGIQDPGNLGGLLRVAAAAGASAVIAGPGCADPWNPKAVRASAGAIFHVRVRRHDAPDLVARLGRAGFRRVAAVPHGGKSYDRLGWQRPLALILGAEGAGLEERTLAAVEDRVSIPMDQEMESLNVLAAATLLLYEARRRPGEARRPRDRGASRRHPQGETKR